MTCCIHVIMATLVGVAFHIQVFVIYLNPDVCLPVPYK